MNRRQLTRWGLMGSLVCRTGSYAIADEPLPKPESAVTMEPVPDSVSQDPPVSLREAIAQGRVTATWSTSTANQVRLKLRNPAERGISVRIDPGTTLTDGKIRWLAGSPVRYEGAFGGAYLFDAGDAPMRSATIPVVPGRESALNLLAVQLTASEPGGKIEIGKSLKAEPVEAWSTDKSLQKILAGLSMLGSSLHVAQGIARRAVDAKDGKAIAGLMVQGRILNEFEKHAVDRYLAEIGKVSSITPETLRNALLAGLLDVQIRSMPGRDAAGKRLAALLEGRSVLGLPLGKLSAATGKPVQEKPLRLEFGLVEVLSADPLRAVLDATLSSHSQAPGGSVRWARTRLTLGSESSDQVEAVDHFLEAVTARLSHSLVKVERTSQGTMFSRFRVENRSPWTIAAIAMRTDHGDADPAVWPLEGLGLSPRARTIVPIPADRAEPVDLRWSPI